MNSKLEEPATNTPPAAAPARNRRFTRRGLLLGAAGIAAAGTLGGSGYWLSRRGVRVGLIGAGVRGSRLANILRLARFLPLYGDVVAIAEVNRAKAEAVRDAECPGAELYEDYTRVLARDDIDAVIIAVPDHWHAKIAIEATKTGKAIYCEKPLSHTIHEGQAIVCAVRESGTTLLVGTQQRSDANYRLACELVRNGRLGEIKRVVVNVLEKGRLGGPFASRPVPAGLNWDAWLGPAPLAEYCPERYQTWNCWWDYSEGELVNWAVHELDIAQWGLGMELNGPIEIEGVTPQGLPDIAGGYQIPREFRVTMTYPNGTQILLQSLPTKTIKEGRDRLGVRFEGTEGRLAVNRVGLYGAPVEEAARNPLPTDAIRLHDSVPSKDRIVLQHLYHFLQCVKQEATPVSDVESSHRSASLCHLGSIAVRMGRKLTWDPVSETFPGDDAANALLGYTYRAPYSMPT
ncbi:MAG: Gfo/Idh/MocA family oxidoreductase [Pirellulales bacterium]|nr:Gfo/Idh/MocA family oxidoreductase [Pirellulales bacterium]